MEMQRLISVFVTFCNCRVKVMLKNMKLRIFVFSKQRMKSVSRRCVRPAPSVMFGGFCLHTFAVHVSLEK